MKAMFKTAAPYAADEMNLPVGLLVLGPHALNALAKLHD